MLSIGQIHNEIFAFFGKCSCGGLWLHVPNSQNIILRKQYQSEKRKISLEHAADKYLTKGNVILGVKGNYTLTTHGFNSVSVSNHHRLDCLLNILVQVNVRENVKYLHNWPIVRDIFNNRWLYPKNDQLCGNFHCQGIIPCNYPRQYRAEKMSPVGL